MVKVRPTRYKYLIEVLQETKPNTILEIGTWSGDRAIEMVKHGLKYGPVHYIGYDLFEGASNETDREELNIKRHFTYQEVYDKLSRLQKFAPGFTFELHKGNTREILKEHKVDFAFIDGGHSVETIRNDYDKVKESKVVVFDDYYIVDGEMHFDLNHFGANVVVEEHEHEIFEDCTDKFRNNDGATVGIVTMAVIRK